MKQTFVQRIKSKGVDTQITREQIANALEKLARDLRKEPMPDPDQEWPYTWFDKFVVTGSGGSIEGRIRLVTNL